MGNNREVWNANSNLTLQRTQYYPSGLPWATTSADNLSTQPYKFNGCEFIEMHGLDATDLGNRTVQNATNQFTTIDRFCEKFPWQSPYVHAGNNPVNNIDINGDSIWVTVATSVTNTNGTTTTQNSSYYYGNDSMGNYGFIDSKGSLYAGSDKFVTNLTTALSELRSKDNGKNLVDFLSKDKNKLEISQTTGMTQFSSNGKLVWNDNGTGMQIETTNGKQTTPSYIELGHDLGHARDKFKGNLNTTLWVNDQKNSIKIYNAEKSSMHLENLIRAEHTQPLRTMYDSTYPQTQFLGPNNTSLYNFMFDRSGFIVPYKY
ncbi:MAG: hypothetical protein GZ091_16280 [Paludibacter sp.]|nr:hypothetical protein [Paludibacter sp.]